MHKFHNPKQIAGPFGHYEHGVETALPGAAHACVGPDRRRPRWRCARGDRGADQVGVANICAVLAEAGMTAQDIVKTNTYILDRDYVPVLAEMRKRFLGEDHRGASTTLVVSSP